MTNAVSNGDAEQRASSRSPGSNTSLAGGAAHETTRYETRLGRVLSRAWWFPVSLMCVYCAVLACFGEMRVEHGLVLALFVVVSCIGPRCRQFILDLTPFAVLAVGYDCVRYVQAAVVRPESVLACGLRDLELRLFAFPFAENMTFPDWFAANHHSALDLAAAVPYFGFVYFAVLYAIFLFVVDRERMRRYLWALAFANYIAFTMYVLLPAAPPWYIQAHGCAIDLSTASNPAGLSRVDDLLGIRYFSSFYARAASVFGALPSMHCAFPMLGLLTAWRSITWKTRWIHLVYALGMVFSAVYLTHHWIIDTLAGWTVAALGVTLMTGGRILLSRIMGKNSPIKPVHLSTEPATNSQLSANEVSFNS